MPGYCEKAVSPSSTYLMECGTTLCICFLVWKRARRRGTKFSLLWEDEIQTYVHIFLTRLHQMCYNTRVQGAIASVLFCRTLKFVRRTPCYGGVCAVNMTALAKRGLFRRVFSASCAAPEPSERWAEMGLYKCSLFRKESLLFAGISDAPWRVFSVCTFSDRGRKSKIKRQFYRMVDHHRAERSR